MRCSSWRFDSTATCDLGRPLCPCGHPILRAPKSRIAYVVYWFHITMRLTVLQQQTKSLQEEGPMIGAAASKQVESVKHLLWHGDVEEALDRVADLLMDLDLVRKHSAPAEKLSVAAYG